MKYKDLASDICWLVRDTRIEKGLTQAQLAKMVKTRQPSIARLENRKGFPSLHFLNKVVRALGMELIITFRDATK